MRAEGSSRCVGGKSGRVDICTVSAKEMGIIVVIAVNIIPSPADGCVALQQRDQSYLYISFVLLLGPHYLV